MAPRPGIDIVSLERFRASLSILLPDTDVRAATANLPDNLEVTSDEFQAAVRSAQLRLFRQWIVQIARSLFNRAESASDPLSRLQKEPTDAGLALVLHIGIGLSAEQLVYLLGSSHARVCRDLLDIRGVLTGRGDHSCKIFLDTIGRYRDSYIDLGLAADITRHRARCAACHVMLRDFEDLDNQIMSAIQAAERAGATVEPEERSTRQRILAAAPVALAGALLLVAIVATAGLAGNLIGGQGTSIYAGSNPPEPGSAGWILLGTEDGGLQAFDPESGRRQTLLEESYDSYLNFGANYLLSPDGERVAIFAQNDVSGLHWATRRIQIVEITGTEVNLIEWRHSVDAGWPTGWLNDRELLIISIPVYEGGETTERFLQRLEEEGSLRAVDVQTGEQRTLYNGAVAQVIPSPDGERLAMVRPRDPRDPGATVDVWEVTDGEIGDLISSVEHRFTWDGNLQWSTSSDALYLGYINEYHESEEDGTSPGRDGDFRGQITEIDILRIDRDGNQEIFADSEHMTGSRIIGTDGDDQAIYATFSLDDYSGLDILLHDFSRGDREALELPEGPAGGELHQQRIMSGTLGYPSGYVSHPDKTRFMLQLRGDHYLPGDPLHHQDPPSANYLTLFDEERQPSVVAALSARWRVQLLRWVSGEELGIDDSLASAGLNAMSGLERVTGIRDYLQLGPDSVLSPNREAMTMEEPEDGRGRPYLWYPKAQTGRWMAQTTKDISWFADGHAMIGVTEARDSGEAVSRLTLHSASQRGGSSVDAFLDPAGIGDRGHLRYARPATSTDGQRVSFYVHDRERNRGHLWLADLEHGAREVHGFRYSTRISRFAPVTGEWLDDRTFLFTEVLEWSSDGLPEQFALTRLTVNDAGDVTIDQLFTVEARGRDRGIAMHEFAVDPTGNHVAFRQRHLTDRDDPSEGYDTIHVAPASDIGQSLEVQRGDFGSGLTWSPDGQTLALEIDRRVGVYSMTEHAFQFVTGSDRAAGHPNWISDRELWFNIGSGSNRDVYRVTFD